ncbi:MAG: PAS domain-containing sensor histidine kinase [Thiotrichales bacterium]
MKSGLFQRFVWGTVAGLVLSSLVFLTLYIGMYRGELAQERANAVENINRLLWSSLENAMLKADVEGLRQIIRELGRQPGIVAVNVTTPSGEIRFTSDESQQGRQIATAFVLPATATTEFVTVANGVEALRSTIPVPNREGCEGCHGPVAANPINGVLLVDYEAAPLKRKAQRTTLLLMGAGSLIVLLNLAGGWWFMRRFVLRPVSLLMDTSERLRGGDLTARVNLRGGDEFASFGETFDQMAGQLERTISELTEERGFLQAMVDAIPDGLRVIDENYRQVLVNQAFLRQLDSRAEVAAIQPCYRTSHARHEPCPPTLLACPLVALAETTTPIKTLHRHVRADGGVIDVEVYAAPLRISRAGREARLVVESIRDLQSQVRYSHEQRLSELGKLAAGVAHEIYNPLSSLRMVVHATIQALEGGQPNPVLRENLTVLDQEVDRCIDITQRLLKLSNLPDDRPEPADIARAIVETVTLLHWEAEQHKVVIETRIEADSMWVMASDSALRMLTMNLVQNAIHALSAKGGRLTIRLIRRAGRVEACFEDDGPGIAPEVLRHIFEPFFSRRADGRHGTGLGLSICRSLVEQYGGELGVTTEIGRGTRFTVSFPDPSDLPEQEKMR